MFRECLAYSEREKHLLTIFFIFNSNTVVSLESRNLEKANVLGIDDFGYLVVRLQNDGMKVTLQPDGNSFDMMKNMIVVKN